MKKILLLLMTLLSLPSPLPAQDFKNLWQAVEQAEAEDRPQTALDRLADVRECALAKGNKAWYLRSLLAEVRFRRSVSPDSARSCLDRLEQQAAAEPSGVYRSLLCAGLGHLLGTWEADTAARRRAHDYWLASLEDCESLAAARTSVWLPLFDKQADSRIFHHDLLSVQAFSALSNPVALTDAERRDLCRRLAAFYEARDCAAGALLFHLYPLWMRLEEETTPAGRIRTLQELARKYEALPENVETYLLLVEAWEERIEEPEEVEDEGREEALQRLQDMRIGSAMADARRGWELYKVQKRAAGLRNFISEREAPRLQAKWMDSTPGAEQNCLVPQTEYALRLSCRGTRQAEVRIYRLKEAAADVELRWPDASDALRKLGSTLVQRLQPAPSACEAWRTHFDTLRFSLPRTGVYLLELRADGKPLDCSYVRCSRLKPLVFTYDDALRGRLHRVTIVDVRTGQPYPLATLHQYREKAMSHRLVRRIEPENGAFLIDSQTADGSVFIAGIAGDNALPAFSLPRRYTGWRSVHTAETTEPKAALFTDRGIYRPGQKICFGGLCYDQHGDTVASRAGAQVEVGLYDTNGRKIATAQCTTDAFGSLGGIFELPAECLPGHFSLRSAEPYGAYASFRVENYVRPTFKAELREPLAAYAAGDTLQLDGTALTYTAIPVEGARVEWTIRRMAYFYRRGEAADYYSAGEGVTDSLGNFRIPVPLTATFDKRSLWQRYAFRVTAAVTAPGGETQTAERTIFLANRSSQLEVACPAAVCRENPENFCVRHVNAAGKNLDGRGTYILYDEMRTQVACGEFETGRPFFPEALSALPSGRYELVVTSPQIQGPGEERVAFSYFSEQDEKPAFPAPFHSYMRQNGQGDSLCVTVGSSDEGALLFYDLVGSGKLLESRRIDCSQRLLHFEIAWREEMGDAARATFALLRDGKFYEIGNTVVRPQPEKQLRAAWSAFRDRTCPGQSEEWHLRITTADGRPADAAVMARMYDAALNSFVKSPWNFELFFPRRLPDPDWSTVDVYNRELFGARAAKMLSQTDLRFTTWAESLFSSFGGGGRFFSRRQMDLKECCFDGAMAPNASVGGVPKMKMRSNAAKVSLTAAPAAPAAGEEAADAGKDNAAVRKNFAETAFFYPSLRTESTGTAVISFITPESLTEWQFDALFHDQSMNYGRISAVCVARKELMTEVAMPRFVRVGDEAVIPVTVRNVSEAPAAGRLTVTLTDARTGTAVKTRTEKFSLDAGKSTVVSLSFTTPAEVAALTCRAVAATADFSDGEERIVPVLSDREQIVRAIPFSLTGEGVHTVPLDTLWGRDKRVADRCLIIEGCVHPVFYALTALSQPAATDCRSATEAAERLYAVVLGQEAGQWPTVAPLLQRLADEAASDNGEWAQLLQRNADLKQVLLQETPWQAEAESEAARWKSLRSLLDPAVAAARWQSALDKLRMLQQADGSWSWYPGMPGNDFITTEVCFLLARLNALAGDCGFLPLLERGFAYLEGEAHREVAEMQKVEKRLKTDLLPSESLLRYLYVRAMLGRAADSDTDYLLDKAPALRKEFTMFGKALMSTVLSRYGRTEEAALAIESLWEHTVTAPGQGRWFDTDRAVGSWRFYKIPTQAAAIEALENAASASPERAEALRLWLLQAKRTQMWEGGRATADAVFALLGGGRRNREVVAADSTAALLYTLEKGRKAVDANTDADSRGNVAGYFRRSYTESPAISATALRVRHEGGGTAWGSVSATYTVPTEAVEAGGNGLTIERSFEVWRRDGWQRLGKGDLLHTGERVRQIFRVCAGQDCDFVALKAARPACLEPVQPLSGYQWNTDAPAYRAVGDVSNDFYFEAFRKGGHVITEEYFVRRAGTYSAGVAKVQCLYAPEYCATSASATLRVE